MLVSLMISYDESVKRGNGKRGLKISRTVFEKLGGNARLISNVSGGA